ncbi:quinone-dependent dihydroorotate dehydrogenase [Blastomonas sp.]|uniref:quinone-dependent dihydroorotate dehydrogenase n=1 Tax=Blastomonas sp. TaxID=1909299 RepID=UPI0035933893
MLFTLARPAIFTLDAEHAHRLTIAALRLAPASAPPRADPMLAMRVAGLDFPMPVGLAPGFDKNAEVPHAMFGFGFGFVEIGTVTPMAQKGNERPRLFRLVEDKAVINRMGFNNDGAEAVVARLKAGQSRPGIIGVNIGANKDSADRIADYATMTQIMVPLARYLTVNISSPNTPGLRALQDAGALAALIDAVLAARGNHSCPVFLKLAPDLEPADIDDITRIALEKRLDALIVSNTTITRPALHSRHAGEGGGLSGEPLRDLAQQCLRDFRASSGGAIPLIGVGGIASAEDAYARIRAGASLVQLYSALVYEGPGLAAKINRGLKALLTRDGFATLADAVGVDVVGVD